jgi:hypothetical protein
MMSTPAAVELIVMALDNRVLHDRVVHHLVELEARTTWVGPFQGENDVSVIASEAKACLLRPQSPPT